MKTFAQSLRDMRACLPAVAWVGDKGLTEAWNTCEEPSWMAWLIARLPIDRKLLVLAACDCAETAWQYCDGETLQSAMLAVHVTREYCAGRADLDDVRAARSAAADAYAAAYAAAAAAADAAADAADAAAYAAYAAAGAADAARRKAKQECAQLIRERVPASAIAFALDQKHKAAAFKGPR